MKKNTIFILLGWFSLGVLSASDLTLGVYGGYFAPKDQRFKDIYHDGCQIGTEINWALKEVVSFQLGFFYQTASGELSLSRRATKIKIVPVTFSARIQKSIRGIVPYAGVGLGLYYFHESNEIGTVSDSKLGFSAEVGVAIPVSGRIGLDFRYRYDTCEVTPTDISANIGGNHFILGLLFHF